MMDAALSQPEDRKLFGLAVIEETSAGKEPEGV